MISKVFETYCRAVFKIYCPLSVRGADRVPDSTFILSSNHNSHMDSAALMVSTRQSFDRFAMIAAQDYFFGDKKTRRLLNLCMFLIPIQRKLTRATIHDSLRRCREFIRDGQAGQRIMIIYPEGTRSTTGKMIPFRNGPGIISVELGLPIVPAYIDGTFRAWPKGQRFMKPKGISVSIGHPIHPDEYCREATGSKTSDFSAYRCMTKELERRVHGLMKEARDAE